MSSKSVLFVIMLILPTARADFDVEAYAKKLCTIILFDIENKIILDRINAPTCEAANKRCLSELKKGLECYRE